MPRKFDFLSPGIEITEVDQSILPAEVDADGPVIIGRFRKGPGMKPVKIRSLDAFISVYGNPVPGGSSLQGDVWRDGAQLSAPTYAAYAAQAWLASRTSPINVVRLLGDEHPSATGTTGNAGWQLSGSVPSSSAADNSTAYGLFIVDKDKVSSDFVSSPVKLTFQSSGSSGNDFISTTEVLTINDGTSTVTFEMIDKGLSHFVTNPIRQAVPILSSTQTATGAALNKLLAARLATAINQAIFNQKLDGSKLEVSHNAGDPFVEVHALDSGTPIVIGESGGGFGGGGGDADEFITSNGTATCTGATTALEDGSLAAIFYCDSGYLTLSGTIAGTSDTSSAALTLMNSNDVNLGFKIGVFDTNSVELENISFNFDRNSQNYIRNKFNTNPQKVNSDVTDSEDLKTYWLGESFERHLKNNVTTSTAGQQYGILLPLHRFGSTLAKNNWSYHRVGSQEAKSGWLIDYDDGTFGDYDASQMTKLFRFESLHAGEEIQKEILIAVEDLKLATNATIYPYGTFTVKIMNTLGGTLEKYSGCNLDPNSPNFISRRIGDMFMEWDETDRRYRSYGNHPNVSDYIRIKMYDEEQNYKSTALPFGFFGPARHKGIGFISGSDGVSVGSSNGTFGDDGPFVATGVNTVPAGNAQADNAINFGSVAKKVRFQFPSISLRKSGSDGFSANPYKVYFGARPKIEKDSSVHDEDYVDLVRVFPSNYLSQLHNPTDDAFEHSFIFSLDDIKVDKDLNTVVYEAGSRKLGTSRTATSGAADLLDNDVKQFVVPLFGGFDGLNIKEKESFNYTDIQATTTDTTNYLVYSLNKALDSVSDPETVPASLLSIPGIKNTHITDKVIRTAEARKDMLAVVDLVGDYTPSFESRGTQKERLGSVIDTISNIKSRQINSSYAAAYYPAVQIQDNLNNGERVWVPSSVAGLGAMAQSDSRAELWFAPAGFNRGGLGNLGGRSGPRVIQARQRLDASERDKLYEVNINPIATFPNEGVVVFGQKTLQQTPSALDRINVRRLMIFLKAEISKVAQGILFDNNVRSTWSRFVADAEPILADVKSKFGLTDYRLILDSSTTTADLIDRNILYAKVFLKPARAIEYIAIDFVITRTGADFA